MSFGAWLQAQLERNEWSQSDFARASGLSTTTISKYIIGPEKPSRLATIQSIASALRVPVADVQAAIRGDTDGRTPRSAEDALAELVANAPLAVPIITDLVAHMGAGGGFIDDYVYLTPDYRRGRKRTIIGVRAKGACMTPLIHDGDVVLFDRESDPKPNDVVVAAIDGQAVVRRLAEVGKRLALRADADGETHVLGDGDQVFGKVIWIMHRLVDAERRNGADKGGRE
jgi:phage repressor protein C with HTH and peptisase S24 domain